MASEAQRIMNLSLTKIVSSRGRRGGVSLHRNLLVASVLFKARDVYAAEMAGLVVIRNGQIYDRDPSPLSPRDDPDLADHQTPEVSEQPAMDASDENVILDRQMIHDTINAVVVVHPGCSETGPSFGDELLADCTDAADLEPGKENLKPLDSNVFAAEPNRSKQRSRKLPSKQCRKRKYTELEQAVLTITEQTDDSGISPSKLRIVEQEEQEEQEAEEEEKVATMSLDCDELSSSLPDWSDDLTSSVGDEQSRCNQSVDYHSESSSSSSSSSSLDSSYSSRSSYDSNNDDDDDDDDDDELKYRDISSSSYQLSCHVDSCSSSNDSISFSLSHPVLVVSV